MITIQNGKLNIPDNDRFVGFAGDNAVNSKQFVLSDFAQEGCTFTLCLRFDDDAVRTAALSAAADGGDTVLTWNIRSEHLYAPGVVQAQVKITDSENNIEHTTKDFFLIGSAVELDDSGMEVEYITPSQLNAALGEITATAPYIDADGYWCVYDPATSAYVRTTYHVSGVVPDTAMSDSSENTVGNKYIKQYADAKATGCNTYATTYTDIKTADKVPDTRTIAQLPLSADIAASDLMAQLRPQLYKVNVLPGTSTGVKGQLGIGPSGEVFFCNATDSWVHLVKYESLYDKMDLVADVAAADVDDVEEGMIFFSGGVLYVKFNNSNVAIAQAGSVYTKAEIDTMIGNIETLLAALQGGSMEFRQSQKWCRAALLRALRTFAQTAAATIGASALLAQVHWDQVLSASLLAAVLSILMSIGGLPEVKEGD